MLTRWDPFTEMVSMREAINRLFNDSYVRPGSQWTGQGSLGAFPFDLYESGDEVVLRIAIPGVDQNQTELTVTQGVLTVKGFRTLYSGDQEKQHTWHARGLTEGAFQMAVSLPTAVNAERAEATYENGIFTITLPKAETVKAKRIGVKHVERQEALTSGSR